MRIIYFCYIILLFLSSNAIFSQNIKLADSLISIGQFSKAIDLYQKESNTVKFFKIAKAYEMYGDLKLAMKSYQKYLMVDSLNVQVNYNYGLLLIELFKFKESQEVFKKLVSENANPLYDYYLGFAYEKDNNPSKALEAYRVASKKDSLHFKSNYKIAVILANNKEYKPVLTICNRFLKLDNENVDMLKLRAQIYFLQNNFTEAINDLKKLIDLNQTDVFIFEKLANSYYNTKEYKNSVMVYTSLIANSDKENADYFFNRGKCFGFLNEPKKAEEDIEKAIGLRTFRFDAEYFYMAYFYQKNNDLKKAMYYYQKTIQQDKNNEESNYQVIAIKDYEGSSPKIIIKEYESFLEKFPNASNERKKRIVLRIAHLKKESK
ncbi:tetratricopeptide repeat protein [Flavobacterium sp.]|uniref:tetratricopeptide repeat protein n=1 Tax=Flavobacterium sp. TaxID=239 RepID=UPI0040475682